MPGAEAHGMDPIVIALFFGCFFLLFLYRSFSMFKQAAGKMKEAGITPAEIAEKIQAERQNR